MRAACKTKRNPLQTWKPSMQAGINQSSSQADEVYFTLKEWPTRGAPGIINLLKTSTLARGWHR